MITFSSSLIAQMKGSLYGAYIYIYICILWTTQQGCFASPDWLAAGALYAFALYSTSDSQLNLMK